MQKLVMRLFAIALSAAATAYPSLAHDAADCKAARAAVQAKAAAFEAASAACDSFVPPQDLSDEEQQLRTMEVCAKVKDVCHDADVPAGARICLQAGNREAYEYIRSLLDGCWVQ